MEMNVLVIDDAQINLTLLCRLLEKVDECHSTSFLVPQDALA